MLTLTQYTGGRPRVQYNIASVIQSGWFYFFNAKNNKNMWLRQYNGAGALNGAFRDTFPSLRE